MSVKGIWFLPRSPNCPPDFTYTEGGQLQLGTILESFNDPTSILFSPATDHADPVINWPAREVVGLEKNHEHSCFDSNLSAGGNVFAKFFSLAKASSEIEVKRQHALKFGKVDHKIIKFKHHLSPTVVKEILAQPNIKEYIEPSTFNLVRRVVQKPIYVVSGLRMVKSSFSVAETKDSNIRIAAGSEFLTSEPRNTPPLALNLSAAHVGISGHLGLTRNNTHSYNTVDDRDIVFAYCLHVIQKSNRARMFSDSSAFMTDKGKSDDLECVKLTEKTNGLEADAVESFENGECVYVGG